MDVFIEGGGSGEISELTRQRFVKSRFLRIRAGRKGFGYVEFSLSRGCKWLFQKSVCFLKKS